MTCPPVTWRRISDRPARPRARLRYPVPPSNRPAKQATIESRANVAYPHPSLCNACLLGARLRRDRRRPGAGLDQPEALLRGLDRPAEPDHPSRDARAAENARRESAARSSSTGIRSRPAPTSATKPSFEATNPGSYNWGQYDILIAEAKRLGWQVLLTVTAPVPSWATANKKAPYTYRPDDLDFQEFMTAVGQPLRLAGLALLDLERAQRARLSDAAVDLQRQARLGAHLPRPLPVRLRGLQAGLKAAGISRAPQVLFGETAPVGDDTVNVRKEKSRALLHPVAPLAFMREALCLNAKYKKSGTCGELQMTGYAHHAYFPAAGPKYVWKQKDSVTIASLSRLSNALNLAARAHAIPGRRADLPDRVRGAEQAEQVRRRLRRQAGRIRRDRRAHGLLQPARGGLLAVPVQRRPDQRTRLIGQSAASSASRPASST